MPIVIHNCRAAETKYFRRLESELFMSSWIWGAKCIWLWSSDVSFCAERWKKECNRSRVAISVRHSWIRSRLCLYVMHGDAKKLICVVGDQVNPANLSQDTGPPDALTYTRFPSEWHRSSTLWFGQSVTLHSRTHFRGSSVSVCCVVFWSRTFVFPVVTRCLFLCCRLYVCMTISSSSCLHCAKQDIAWRSGVGGLYPLCTVPM